VVLQPSRGSGFHGLRKLYRNVSTRPYQNRIKTRAPDDVVTVEPERPNGVDHDLSLGNCAFNRHVVPNVYYKNANVIVKLELSLEPFQFLL